MLRRRAGVKTSVVPWASRYRAAWPFAMSLIGLVLFLSGLVERDIRTDPVLRPYVWGALIASGAFALLAIALRPIWRRALVIDQRGVRVGAIDLGAPARVQHGAFDQLVVMGSRWYQKRNVTHLWIAVTGERDPRTVVFVRQTAAWSKTDWPRARPPEVADTFDGRYTDFVALRAAIGGLIR